MRRRVPVTGVRGKTGLPLAELLRAHPEVLSASVGHRVAHRELSIDQAVDGTEGFERELTQLTFERVHAGSFATVTDTVGRLTRRPARTLREFPADQ